MRALADRHLLVIGLLRLRRLLGAKHSDLNAGAGNNPINDVLVREVARILAVESLDHVRNLKHAIGRAALGHRRDNILAASRGAEAKTVADRLGSPVEGDSDLLARGWYHNRAEVILPVNHLHVGRALADRHLLVIGLLRLRRLLGAKHSDLNAGAGNNPINDVLVREVA